MSRSTSSIRQRTPSERQRRITALRGQERRAQEAYRRERARATALYEAARLAPAGPQRRSLYARAHTAKLEAQRQRGIWLQFREAREGILTDVIVEKRRQRPTALYATPRRRGTVDGPDAA